MEKYLLGLFPAAWRIWAGSSNGTELANYLHLIEYNYITGISNIFENMVVRSHMVMVLLWG
jgi:hypothetical protein